MLFFITSISKSIFWQQFIQKGWENDYVLLKRESQLK